ncbi:MAG: ATP synthase F1 subunit delta [Clostridium sp.]|nr:ATP synthase F1 subunit delta [Clostridium sp.]
MDQGLIPKRYAKAIYEVAQERGDEKGLYETMRRISASFAAEPKLNATLNNPFVPEADKEALILTAAGAEEGDKRLMPILSLLKQNGRIGMMRDIAAAYEGIYRKANRIYRVTVTAAAPMEKAEEERLKEMIKSHLNGGAMEYTFREDPELIGGFTVSIDNERLDASVKNELKQLRLKLLRNN